MTTVIVIYLYLHWALALFPWTRFAGRTMLNLVIDPVRTILRGIVGYLPELFFLIVLAMFARWILRAVKALFAAIENGRIVVRSFEPEWAQPTYRIVRFLLLVLLAVIAYPYIPGSGSDAFKGVSLLIGVLLSIGSSSLIANLLAGYTMIYRRAFRLGDRIRVKDCVGDVTAIRPLAVALRTPKNEQIVIPNSEILNNPIVNYSTLERSNGLILHTNVGIGYEVPWRQVEAMLMLAAERTEGLLHDRPAFVLQTKLGDFCIQYELNVYCAAAQRMNALYTALHRNILDIFNEYGVQIMTPAYERDPDTPKLVPAGRWHEPPASPPGSQSGTAAPVASAASEEPEPDPA
jgi:small-conductance mechanosensitive channel